MSLDGEVSGPRLFCFRNESLLLLLLMPLGPLDSVDMSPGGTYCFMGLAAAADDDDCRPAGLEDGDGDLLLYMSMSCVQCVL